MWTLGIDLGYWLPLLASTGVLGAVGYIAKQIWDRRTGRSARKMRDARDAIDAMGEAAVWAEAYWRARSWCRRHHGHHPGYPPPAGIKEDTK